VADYFQGRLNLTPDVFQSDEKFVLEVAALLGERTAEAQPVPARVRRHGRVRA
jgi:hypothetical protein